MAIKIWPYRQGSNGARALAAALNGRVLRRQGGVYRFRQGDTVINWGDPDPPDFPRMLNSRGLRQASNKLAFFQLMVGRGLTPEYWTDREHIPDDAFPIVCRTVLAGHSGEGIVIAGNRQELVPAPLYVKYVKKAQEYRIHVGRRNDELTTISVQRKARREGAVTRGERVWNHQNGFVYVRGDVNPPEPVLAAAQASLAATELDFGAVDVIWNERQQRAYALEINTAPGLEGTTIDHYRDFFNQ